MTSFLPLGVGSTTKRSCVLVPVLVGLQLEVAALLRKIAYVVGGSHNDGTQVSLKRHFQPATAQETRSMDLKERADA